MIKIRNIIKYKLLLLIFTATISILCSCIKKPDNALIEQIKINPNLIEDEVLLSEFADSIIYVKLKTEKDIVLGHIHSIIIKKKHIYVSDLSHQAVFIFDKNGEYVSKLSKQGRGPGEYNRLGPIFIDEDENFIEMIAYSGQDYKLLTYSTSSFELIQERKIPEINTNSARKKDNIYYFATQQLDNFINNEKTNSGLLILKDDNIVQELFKKRIETNGSNFSPNIESFTINNFNELFISIMYDNHFYSITEDKAKAILHVDFGKYGIDNSIGAKSLKEQFKYIENIKGLAAFPVLNINNSNVLAITYLFKSDNKLKFFKKSEFGQYIYFKNINKVYHSRLIKNDLTGFPENIYISSYYHSIAHKAWYEDGFIDIVTPALYLMQHEKETAFIENLGQITENDNPIIVYIQLKKELQ